MFSQRSCCYSVPTFYLLPSNS